MSAVFVARKAEIMKLNPSGIILAIIWSPLLILAIWSYRRPQDRFRRIWARHFSVYLFLAYLLLALPAFFLGPSQTLGRLLGRVVGMALFPAILVTFISARISARKLQPALTLTASVSPHSETERRAG
jgi:hypothetical protein